MMTTQHDAARTAAQLLIDWAIDNPGRFYGTQLAAHLDVLGQLETKAEEAVNEARDKMVVEAMDRRANRTLTERVQG